MRGASRTSMREDGEGGGGGADMPTQAEQRAISGTQLDGDSLVDLGVARKPSLSVKQVPTQAASPTLPTLSVPRNETVKRSGRQSIIDFVREPRQVLQQLRVLPRPSFRRKVLRANTLHIESESHLTLGSFRSRQVSLLVFVAKFSMSLGPMLQLIWTIFIEPDRPSPISQQEFSLTSSDGMEAAIQLLVIIASCVFTRQTLAYAKRQPLQLVLVRLANLFTIIGAMTLSADMLKSYQPHATHGRQLLSFANALLATSIFLTISCLTDHFAETILASREAFQHQRQERLLQRSRHLSFALSISCGFYLAVRLVLTWRSSVVFDFIPAANFITPVRIEYREHKQVDEHHVLLDAVILSIFDALLLALAFVKCSFTHRLFRHIFISDFARRYTEFRIFVVTFQSMIVTITLSGHIAAWAVPFYHTINPTNLSKPRVPVVTVGSVQMQLGFRLSLALWLLTAIYCASPITTKKRGLMGCFGGQRTPTTTDVRIKYFLSQAEALQKTAYRNLHHVGHADANEFILEHHIEAFNCAQLVYARGNSNYDQEHASVQRLVGDPSFQVMDIVHDAKTDTHCLILASPTKIVVAFRGTLSKTNAHTDLQSAMTLHLVAKQLDLTKVPSLRPHALATPANVRTIWHRVVCKRNNPKVHSGFYAAFLSVADRVLDHVHSLYECEKRLIVTTGHSLGGALAVLCAFDLVARQKISNVACTTFGCPRIGNHAFQKRYALVVPATFAFVNASDMITKLPPKTPKAQSYASVGKTVLINAFGNMIIEPNLLELDVMHCGYSPKAHTMRAYQLALLRWCLRSHTTYDPPFWQQSLGFLQAEYGHLPDVHEYLRKSSVLKNRRVGVGSPTHVKSAEAPATRTQFCMVVRRLETALQQAREDREDHAISLSLVAQLRQWVWRADPREWFSTDDALLVLVTQLQLSSEAAALELAQSLTVQGLLQPERAVFTRNARFSFPLINDDEIESEEANGEADRDDTFTC